MDDHPTTVGDGGQRPESRLEAPARSGTSGRQGKGWWRGYWRVVGAEGRLGEQTTDLVSDVAATHVRRILRQPVDPRDTHSTLLPRLATAAGDLVVDFLSKLHRAVFTPQTTFPQSCPQEHEARTRAPKITHARAHIAFTRHSAPRIDAWNRAAGHQHPAWFNFDHLGAGGEDQPAKNAVQIISAGLYSPGLHSATDLDDKLSKLEVGEALFGKAAAPLPSPPSGASDQVNYDQGTIADGVTDTASQHSRRLPREPRLLVRCAPDATLKSEATDINTAEAFLDIRRVKPAGRKEMDVRAWLDGVKETRGLKNYGVIKLQKDVGQGSNSTDV